MVRIVDFPGSYPRVEGACFRIRRVVFVGESGYTEDEEFDVKVSPCSVKVRISRGDHDPLLHAVFLLFRTRERITFLLTLRATVTVMMAAKVWPWGRLACGRF